MTCGYHRKHSSGCIKEKAVAVHVGDRSTSTTTPFPFMQPLICLVYSLMCSFALLVAGPVAMLVGSGSTCHHPCGWALQHGPCGLAASCSIAWLCACMDSWHIVGYTELKLLHACFAGQHTVFVWLTALSAVPGCIPCVCCPAGCWSCAEVGTAACHTYQGLCLVWLVAGVLVIACLHVTPGLPGGCPGAAGQCPRVRQVSCVVLPSHSSSHIALQHSPS
jgi:hypothetical protein